MAGYVCAVRSTFPEQIRFTVKRYIEVVNYILQISHHTCTVLGTLIFKSVICNGDQKVHLWLAARDL